MADEDLKILSEKEIQTRLEAFSGWKYGADKISKEFKFKSFSDAVNFVVGLALFCNGLDHHPDIHIFYKKILFELQRFSVGGKVTERDFTVAKEIEKLYSNYPGRAE